MADETTPQNLPEVPADLDALTDESLVGLRGEVVTARAALIAESREEGVGFSRVREIRAAVAAIDADLGRLDSAFTERMEVANDLAALDTEVPPLPTAETPPVDPPADSSEEPAEPTPAEAEPVTAGLTPEEIASAREPQVTPIVAINEPRRAALVAPAGSQTVAPGTALELTDIGNAVQELARGGNDGKTRFASIAAFEHDLPHDEMLTQGNTFRNDELIHEAQAEWRRQFDAGNVARRASADPDPRTAAICTPLDAIREIPDNVQASEPFSDALPSRAAGRLGFQYTPAILLSAVSSGVDIWDDTDQASVVSTDQGTWKPCVSVACPTPASVTAEAITACFNFDNTTEMSNPERIRDAMSKIAAQRARVKTGRLLAIADTLSVHFEATAPYGALDGIVHIILSTLPQGKYPERLDDSPYLFFMPPGFLEALVIDRAHQTAKADFDRGSVTDYIESECAAAGWNVRCVALDDVAQSAQAPFATLPAVGAAAKAALVSLGGTTRPFKARLIAPESALYFSTGEINMGIERSPELNRQNKAQWFAEEYVGLAKNGSAPWYTLHLIICPTGSRAALTTPFSCPTSAS